MTRSPLPALLFVEHVVWQPTDSWREALEHLASRFARVAPLDVDALLDGGAFHQQVAAVDDWAAAAGADPDRELGRWFDEHLSMHVRPAPTVTRAVRALAATGPVHAASALPPRAAESLLRHAGCWRSITELHGGVTSADRLDQLLTPLAPRTVIAAEPTPLPAGLAATPLAAAV